jgi:hypothetical protein|nr:MAG TPA: Pyruvate formate-lyase 1-activating enzyme [Caudoviricetes sp.]
MNKELIEILKSIRIWAIDSGVCKGGIGNFRIATKCDFRCEVCPIFQTSNKKVYSNQITSIPLN